MKIAISGCAGIGKSTLAQHLATALNLPMIAEHYEPLFPKSRPVDETPQTMAQRFLRVLNHKKELEQQSPEGFVTDRCPVDLFHAWSNRPLLLNQQEQTRRFHQLCRQQVQHYDWIILPPVGVIPLKQLEEQHWPKKRNLNVWVQLRNHAAITGLSHLWLPTEKIRMIPDETHDPQQRVDWVMRQLHRTQPACGA